MEEFEKQLTVFAQRYNKEPTHFIRRVIACLLKFPELMEIPDCQKIYEEGLEYLVWYDNKGTTPFEKAKETELQLITSTNKNLPDYAYKLPVLIEYLIFREKL